MHLHSAAMNNVHVVGIYWVINWFKPSLRRVIDDDDIIWWWHVVTFQSKLTAQHRTLLKLLLKVYLALWYTGKSIIKHPCGSILFLLLEHVSYVSFLPLARTFLLWPDVIGRKQKLKRATHIIWSVMIFFVYAHGLNLENTVNNYKSIMIFTMISTFCNCPCAWRVYR